jgi:hypothetical protein
MFTESFSEVLKEIEVLSDNEQNEIASLLSEELKWSKSFAKSQDLLSSLAEEALAEFRSGKTKPATCQ